MKRNRTVWCVIGFMVLGLFLSNCPFLFEERLSSLPSYVMTKSSYVTLELNRCEMKRAGWPFEFYVQNLAPNEAPESSFKIVPFLLNNLMILGAGIFLSVYEWRIPRRRTEGEKRRFHLSDLFIGTFLVAVAFGYWGLVEQQFAAETQLENTIKQTGGTVVKTIRLAEPFGIEFPYLTDRFTRISRVWAASPDSETLQKIAQLPQLEFLEVFGGSYDSSALEQALSNPNLRTLRIADRPLDDPFIKRIGSAKQLLALSLAGTDISDGGLAAIGPMPSLKFLDLQNTSLDSPRSAPCAITVHQLVCPALISRQMKISGLKHLKRLEIRQTETLNTARSEVETICHLNVADLPNLESIFLDRGQVFDVNLENVPKLNSIQPANKTSLQSADTAARIVDSPMIRSLRMENAPSLKSLQLDGIALEQLTTGQMDYVELSLTPEKVVGQVTLTTINAKGAREYSIRNFGTISTAGKIPNSNNLSSSLNQRQFDSIVACSGLTKLNLGVHLIGHLNLSRLAASQSLRSLKLIDNHLTTEQIDQLSQCSNLAVLEMPLYQVSERDLEQLATRLPKISELRCIIPTGNRLNLEHVPNLETLFGDASNYLIHMQPNREIRLLNLPKLTDSFQLISPMTELHLENLSSIPALTIHHPIPPNSVLRGLDSLIFFAGGGPNLNDDLLRDVLQSKKLKVMVLVYASASSETLKRIGQLPDLEHLVLTGCNVHDDVVESLGELRNLKTLRLEETKISSASLTALQNIPSLLRLSISDTPAASGDLSELKTLKSLTRLDVAGSKSATGLGAALRAMTNLQLVDLGRSVLSDELMSDWLQSSNPTLRAVNMRDSQFNELALIQALGNKNIQIAVEGAELSADSWASLDTRGQLVGQADEFPPAIDLGKPVNQVMRISRFPNLDPFGIQL
ncbi:MAG: hypothetical protein ABL921_25695, partial [Pirellula sp.]